MQKLRDHTAALEGRTSTVEDDMAPLQRDVRHVQSLTTAHAAELGDMENRMRRNNIIVVGIPEKPEGKNPVMVIKRWLTETFGRDSFSQIFSMERAHRVPTSPYPDFSAELQCRRVKFTEVKKRLRRFGVTYAMLYPARMRMAANNETHFFDNPNAVYDWLDGMEHTLRRMAAT